MTPPHNSPYGYPYPLIFTNTVIAVVLGLIAVVLGLIVYDLFMLVLRALVTVVAGFLTS